MTAVRVVETFVSIQGESTFAGLPCFFVRLAGCNLRCRYCDTREAWEGGRPVSVDELVAAAAAAGAPIAELTGGEPLLQAGFPELADRLLRATGRPVLVETNGSLDISVIPPEAIAVMDVKCPGSGEAARMERGNFARLRPHDEVKFVIADRADYEWARDLAAETGLTARCRAVLFSPVHGRLGAAELGSWIVADRLAVRLNLQLHKMLGVK